MPESTLRDPPFTDVHADGSDEWITGYGPLVHGDGTTWTEDPGPANHMIAIDGAGDEIWAVGYQNRIVHREGSAWVRDW
jgi:hypothetical protein